jgi:transposase
MAADPTIDLWAMDEVHFQQYGSRCRMWIPPEVKDPVILHQPTRKGIGYFGAVRLRDGKFFWRREQNKFNAQACQQFLRELHEASRDSDRRAVVIADNATYHHARLHKDWREANSSEFALDFLPPYSPELNPAERVWKLTRRTCTHNRHFATLDDLIATVEPQFDKWSQPNDVLRRLCAII